MLSIALILVVVLVNVLVVPSATLEQVKNKSPIRRGFRGDGLDKLYSKSPPDPSLSKHLQGRSNRRRGKSCVQRSDTPNPLRDPFDTANPGDNDLILPNVRTPFADSDERYCPMFQYAVCDSGVYNERILRVGAGKWRLINCHRCE